MRQPAKAKPYRPPDAAEIESFLDYIAGLMARRQPHLRYLYLPIWRALERELAKAKAAEAIYAAARDRLTRSTGQTEARSS